jgi:hypothetical protein
MLHGRRGLQAGVRGSYEFRNDLCTWTAQLPYPLEVRPAEPNFGRLAWRAHHEHTRTWFQWWTYDVWIKADADAKSFAPVGVGGCPTVLVITARIGWVVDEDNRIAWCRWSFRFPDAHSTPRNSGIVKSFRNSGVIAREFHEAIGSGAESSEHRLYSQSL